MTIEIALQNGLTTLIDDEDHALASLKWSVRKSGESWRVYRLGENSAGQRKRAIYLYRQIMNADVGVLVDHVNGDTLDNRRQNLRLCSSSQNVQNQRIQPRNTTGFKGVSRHRSGFRAQICVRGLKIKLGTFRTADQAARVYDEAAVRLHGDFAAVNFPIGGQVSAHSRGRSIGAAA